MVERDPLTLKAYRIFYDETLKAALQFRGALESPKGVIPELERQQLYVLSHKIKGGALFFNLTALSAEAGKIELGTKGKGTLSLTPPLSDALNRVLEEIALMEQAE